jgi:hypothetical protein
LKSIARRPNERRQLISPRRARPKNRPGHQPEEKSPGALVALQRITRKKMALSGTFWHFLRGCLTPISFCQNNLGQIDPEFGAIFWHWPDSYED